MSIHASKAQQLRWVYRAWRYRLKLEKQEIGELLRILRPGDVAVDIGAHKGAYTYWMIKCVGRGGHVFAFEPQSLLARNLDELVESRGLRNVTVENVGVSSAPGRLSLTFPDPKGSPSATFEHRNETTQGSREISVIVTNLDEYFINGPGARTGRIRLIKCDTEGHELEVFRGARRLIEAQAPVLLFECEQRHRSRPMREVFEYLREFGYKGWFFASHGLEPMENFDMHFHQCDPADSAYVNNFLFNSKKSKT